MRWPNCHVGNVRQVPIGDQDVVNPEPKVPEGQLPEEEEEVEEIEPVRARTSSDTKASDAKADVSDKAGASDKADGTPGQVPTKADAKK